MKQILSKVVVDLLIFQVFFWLVVIVFDVINTQTVSTWIIVLLVINAILYAIAAYIVKEGNLLLEYAVLFFLLFNIILSFTDQFGLMDVIILIVNVITLGLLGWLVLEDRKTE